ncbi:hypothetical protein [Novosphingobium sp.]|uniref:hypothetical protein n=1 Tax=Novosphingobium sp. TaxID=1874826 RepID=UPI003B51D97C
MTGPSRSEILRQVSIAACIVGLATATVYFLARWKGIPVPQWMPMLIAMMGGYELVQWAQALWLKRAGR